MLRDFGYSDLNHVLSLPEMYVGSGPEASNSLCWFLNGYMAAKDGFVFGGFLHMSLCGADNTKTLAENAKEFKAQIERFLSSKKAVVLSCGSPTCRGHDCLDGEVCD
jgi:hypothetical protein